MVLPMLTPYPLGLLCIPRYMIRIPPLRCRGREMIRRPSACGIALLDVSHAGGVEGVRELDAEIGRC